MSYYDASTAVELEPAGIVLAELYRRAVHCEVALMVIGAAARDILIRHTVGSAPQRATADIDIAVAVSSWTDVDCLTDGLERTRHTVHKFLVHGVEVDVIPFGGIESENHTITWPNDHMMNVLGFDEALATAVNVKLPGDVTVAVASLAAQTLLKLFAWRDRRHQDRRDAIDLKTILSAYHQGPYLEELYAEHERLLVKHDYDPVFAGAERMGREANAIIAPDTWSVVTGQLSSQELFNMLATDMGGPVDENRGLLSAYRDGFA